MINNVRERNPMPEQPREVRCSNFDEVALGYTEADAIREAMRCLNCRKQPCAACGLWRPSDSACERKITPWITP